MLRGMQRVSSAVVPPRLWRPPIDLIDAGMRRLLRLRQRLVRGVAAGKRRRNLPSLDPAREAAMLARAQRDARHLDLDETAAEQLLALSLRLCRSELDAPLAPWNLNSMQHASPLLRLLPPPQRLAPLLRLLPRNLLREASARSFRVALAAPLAAGEFDPIQGRRLAIEARDLRLRWVVTVTDADVEVLEDDTEAEATISGTATDLLLLAARLEDADTLFFQRRLQLTGDVELGLTARNLLDRLPWEKVPLTLRILVHRLARLGRAAREAHHAARTQSATAVPDG